MKKQNSFTYLFKIAGNSLWLLLFSGIFSVISGILDFVPFIMLYRVLLFLFGENPNADLAKQYALYAVIAIISKFLTAIISGALSHIGAFNTLYEIRCKLSAQIAKVHLGFFNSTTSGNLKKNLIEDTERIEKMLAHQVPDLFKAITVPLIMFIYLCTVNWQLALCLLIPIILGGVILSVGMKSSSNFMSWYQKLVGQLNSSIMQFINGMNVMKAFNVTAKGFKQYSDTVAEYHEMWVSCTKAQSGPYGTFMVLIESGIFFSFPIGGWLYLQDKIELPVYLFFMIMSVVFFSSLKSLQGFSMAIVQIMSGTDKIRQIMDVPQQEFGEITTDVSDNPAITFEEVSFAYEENDVLHEVSLEIPAKSLTAFVGVSGSGKTTTAQLIPRFWDNQSGVVKIAGSPINHYSEKALMNAVSFVFQESFMLHDTIWENIAVGKENATEEEIFASAKAAQIHETILALPAGYQTHLGEAGIKMSGGEKQRICIARAILKNSPILIFDEATSFTDMENERKIQLALNELLKDKTTIMIAHRLHTIVNADQICVFDSGKVIEQGTHPQLLAQNGRYAQMWQSYTAANMEVSAND
ncbi:ATP-binding cassette subfamily B protein IrtA [Enterococcus sp. PF1-24]|uniref:ABC transporter ATP-binding protein n=1 Tax=unclassified Enterococcus TaxID=2608891 RepID=UPI0024747FC8|nr:MULTISPECIES: ABC transporter ATP-binding protein [unclassified Enterococcus]MDH6364101.1 ATP-binding cassette subfamily B protein IrtA [Enterococcus sp. PFB1-1]MDH6401202.1 ATP-binding cassette subfamily B protein IrtA [Enterococcus sp. PF1-24]